MKLLIDSNIIIDVLNNREPFYNTSSVIWNYCETNDKINGYISTLTFANVVYIVRKKIEKRKVNIFYKSMKKIFEFIDFTEKDIEKASEMQWLDFEDSIQYVLAEKVNADYIITRNIKDFEAKAIQAITPEEFILKFETEG